MASKYDLLTDLIERKGGYEIELTTQEIEKAIDGKLPATAKKKEWWSNRKNGTPQSKAWLNIGYKAVPMLEEGVIKFVHNNKPVYARRDPKGIPIWNKELILTYRKFLGLTQKQFGEKLSIRQQTVADWEVGKHSPANMACIVLHMFAKGDGFYDLKKLRWIGEEDG